NDGLVADTGEPIGSHRATAGQAWHTQSVEAIFRAFATDNAGLRSDEAVRRLDRYGPNELRAHDRSSAWATIAAQFKKALILILILLAATVVSALVGHTLEAIVIALIVLFAVLLGFIQEFRAGRALDALKRMAAPRAHVIRDGVERTIESAGVVPGDMLVLRA